MNVHRTLLQLDRIDVHRTLLQLDRMNVHRPLLQLTCRCVSEFAARL